MIKIIDYKAGNAPSVLCAVRHLGFEADLAQTKADLAGATHIILPGVGSAKATMQSLHEMDLLPPLEEAVLQNKTPFLGICVGMQILFAHSEEENTTCLGWLKGNVVKFDNAKVRVPQMGWNKVRFVKQALQTVQEEHFYFVNSYYAMPQDPLDLWGETDYNGVFAAAVCKDNLYGTQFHTEKSGEAGLQLLQGFLALSRECTLPLADPQTRAKQTQAKRRDLPC